MKRCYLLLLFQFATSSILAQLALKGTITESLWEEPVANAEVRIYRGGILHASTYTNLQGHYRILGLDPGTYSIKIAKFGYHDEWIKTVLLLASESRVVNGSISVIFTLRDALD